MKWKENSLYPGKNKWDIEWSYSPRLIFWVVSIIGVGII